MSMRERTPLKKEMRSMKIAVPVREGRFSSHFGGAEAFALFTVDDDGREVREHSLMAPPEHGRGIFPMWLSNQGVTTVLAGGMGPRASNILIGHGIEVVLGANGDDPEVMVRKYLEGTLESSGELCHDHGFHDCGHHHSTDGCDGQEHPEEPVGDGRRTDFGGP
jgi:predicted Fe-Mo cluster-binding NifX family protein